MKFRTTQKEIKNNYSKIVEIGYCDLQYLLRYFDPVAYTCGVYGWNADIYIIDNIVICTGYRPFGNIRPNWQIIEKYNNMGRKLVDMWDFEKAKEQAKQYIKQFYCEIMEAQR